jgi:hypothetical protein
LLLAAPPLFFDAGGGQTVSTEDEVDPQKLLSGFKASQRELQLPLVFFSIMLAVWVATWFGLYLLF